MGRLVLREGGRLALELFGALILSTAVSAISVAGRGASFFAFLTSWAGRLVAVARLDLGMSAISGLPVAQDISERAPVTLSLIFLGSLIAVLFGGPLGVVLNSGPFRRVMAPFTQVLSSAPVFCAGLALAFAAHGLLGWPVTSAEFPSAASLLRGDLPALRIAFLPALTVGLAGMAAIHVAWRRSSLTFQDEPFRLGLRRLGLTALEIDQVYVAPLVLGGLLGNLGDIMLALLSATVVAEWVFSCPGVADLFVKSVALHDWNMVAAILLFFVSLVLVSRFLGRLLSDILTNAGHSV